MLENISKCIDVSIYFVPHIYGLYSMALREMCILLLQETTALYFMTWLFVVNQCWYNKKKCTSWSRYLIKPSIWLPLNFLFEKSSALYDLPNSSKVICRKRSINNYLSQILFVVVANCVDRIVWLQNCCRIIEGHVV